MSWAVKVMTITNKSNGGKPIQCPSIACPEGLQLKANRKNEDSVFIAPNQGSFSGTDESFPLDAFDSILMPVRNANEIWIRTDSDKEVKVHLLAVSK